VKHALVNKKSNVSLGRIAAGGKDGWEISNGKERLQRKVPEMIKNRKLTFSESFAQTFTKSRVNHVEHLFAPLFNDRIERGIPVLLRGSLEKMNLSGRCYQVSAHEHSGEWHYTSARPAKVYRGRH
jgi:hypothetical protein